MSRRKLIQLFMLFVVCAILVSSCAGIQGPVAIQSWLDEPLDGMEIATGETITLRAHARDVNGQGIVQVRFLVNGELISTAETNSSLPLVHATTQWRPDAPGTYSIEAVAVGGGGTLNSTRANVKAVGDLAAPPEIKPATTYYPPEIVNVSGPSSIPADGQSYDFTVTFRDQDGDISTINVNANNWSDISLNVPQQIASGDLTYGTVQFRYKCPVGTNSFSDTLNIYASDANGKTSASYSFPLACEGQSAPPPPPQTTHPPVIASVNGPSTITANSGRQYFYVSFTDADGDADRIVVKSDQGRWGTIDFGSPLPLDSGNSGNGVVSFYYTCSSSSSFSDTLRVTIFDAAGNASNAYPFDLGCERPLQFPPQQFASHVSLTFPGGHGSIHRIGESAKLCYTFKDTYFGEGGVYKFYLYDFQPASPGSGGVDTSGPHTLLASGRADVGTYCFDGAISGPAGYEAFRIEIFQPALPTDIFIEFAELWIYVQP